MGLRAAAPAAMLLWNKPSQASCHDYWWKARDYHDAADAAVQVAYLWVGHLVQLPPVVVETIHGHHHSWAAAAALLQHSVDALCYQLCQGGLA
jgi:hypothetical protein